MHRVGRIYPRFLTLHALFFAACMPSPESTATLQPERRCPFQGSKALTWFYPSDADDHRALERWCVVVGPPVVDSVPAGSFGALAAGDSLAVAVWNTDAGAGHLMAFLRDELGLTCQDAASRLRAGSAHFVLLLQEALRRSLDVPEARPQASTPPPVKEDPHPGLRLDVVEVGERCGLALAYVAGARNGHALRDGKREDKGEAILSTLPLSDIVAIELPYEASRRVAVAATVHNRRGDSLRVASAHLISMTAPWRILRTGNSSRQRQALAVVAALRLVELQRAGADSGALGVCYPRCGAGESAEYLISTIVAGDLNTWSTRETALRHLFEHLPDSPPALSVPTRGPFPTDHLLFRRNARWDATPDEILTATYRRIDDPYYSDHHPIIAWFRFGSQ